MKKAVPVAVLTVICIILCACSMQKSADIYVFSDRLFKLMNEKPYEPSAYYFDGNNRYNYFLSVSDTRTAMITLTVSEDLSVRSFEITLTRSGQPVGNSEREYILKLLTCACSVLTQKSVEYYNELFVSNGLTKDSLDFSACSLPFESDAQSFFIYSNSEIISLYTEIT